MRNCIALRHDSTTTTTPRKITVGDSVAPYVICVAFGTPPTPRLLPHYSTSFITKNLDLTTPQIDSYPSKYELCNSFIFDTGATGHVCNNRSRFIRFSPAEENDFLLAGNDTIKISGWGDVDLRTICPGWPDGRPLVITNVACVESSTVV
jgi:hypothetical protein